MMFLSKFFGKYSWTLRTEKSSWIEILFCSLRSAVLLRVEKSREISSPTDTPIYSSLRRVFSVEEFRLLNDLRNDLRALVTLSFVPVSRSSTDRIIIP